MPALDGIRVVEAGLLVQGPQASQTLGDWGADVVKVELPVIGDQARWLPAAPGDTRSAYFTACNRGKRSATIDLRTPGGRDAFLRLCARADVVISNFAPGTMERWGLAYEDVAAVNDRSVYAVGSTFGHAGPDAQREGADLAAQAAGGLLSTTGTDGGPPSAIGATIADQNLVAGILAALLVRERTGRGQRVETSLVGGQIWAQASEVTAHLLTGRVQGPANRSHPLIPSLYGIVRTADGWIALVGLLGPARTRFFEAIGRPRRDERFGGLALTEEQKVELWPLLDEALATRTTAEWGAVLDEARVRWAPVRDHAQVVADAGTWANGYVTEVGGVRLVPPPVAFSATPAAPATGVPALGEHTDDVLAEAGLTAAEIAALRDAGAL